MKRIISVLMLCLITLSVHAQHTNANIAALTHMLDSLQQEPFAFERQLNFFSINNTTLNCVYHIDGMQFDKMVSDLTSDYTAEQFTNIYDTERSKTLANLLNDNILGDSAFIYLLKGIDAVAFNKFFEQHPQAKNEFREQQLTIKCSVLDNIRNDTLCTYDITPTNLAEVNRVKTDYKAFDAEVLYMRCYSTLKTVLFIDKIMPVRIDDETISEQVIAQDKTITCYYQISDESFQIEGLKEYLQNNAQAYTANKATWFLKYIGYRMRYVYRNANKTKSFSFYVF